MLEQRQNPRVFVKNIRLKITKKKNMFYWEEDTVQM